MEIEKEMVGEDCVIDNCTLSLTQKKFGNFDANI